MNYAYICTNYNNAHFTRDAVRTINENTYRPCKIIIVDNQSEARDVQELERLAGDYENVELVLNFENLGYFSGLNAGIDRMRAINPAVKTMVIGNNDLKFPPDFGECLSEVVASSATRPVISPYIETLDGIPQNPHVVSGISRTREFIYDLYYANYYIAKMIRQIARFTGQMTDRVDEEGHATAQYIYQGHGSCYILTSTFFDEFDRLWSPTFLMGEEFFLSRQLSDRGFMTYYDPRVRIQHCCNGAIKDVPAYTMWRLARDAHRVYRRYVKPWRRQDYRKSVKSDGQ